MINELLHYANLYYKDFFKLCVDIHKKPELSGEEYFASGLLVNRLKNNSFDVEYPYLGIKTAFRATYDSHIPGPAIAFLAEYDALPEIGHGCGHNLIAAVGTYAGILCAHMNKKLGGRIIVLGCPAEETNGAKVQMAEAGIFSDIDIAMMAHPYHCYQESGSSSALQAIRFEYFGEKVHATEYPNKGANALEGVLELFNWVKHLQIQMRSDASINGIIPDGGVAANIIPDYACADFHVRANDSKYLNELVNKMKWCAEQAAKKTGTEVKGSHYEISYQDMRSNQCLSKIFTKNLRLLGCTNILPAEHHKFSLDMGNVSQVCPSIHPYFDICNGTYVPLHTDEFCGRAGSEYGIKQAFLTTEALALTGSEILENSYIVQNIRHEFDTVNKSKNTTILV